MLNLLIDFLLLCAINYSTALSCLKHPDKVVNLPNLIGQANFCHYSGYLTGNRPEIKLHYWLIEAENDPEHAPLLLWLNGGPGCSSLEGLLTENGPFTFANVLYLEAPAGVGFSYASDGNVTTSDDLTSLNNYKALKSFLEKFPAFKGRDFFITGESYAGVYIPTLAVRVIQGDLDLKLKAIAVGNGLSSYTDNDNSLFYFMNYHGLLDANEWINLLALCCQDQQKSKCDFTNTIYDKCRDKLQPAVVDRLKGLNIYNLYSPCAGGVVPSSSSYFSLRLPADDVASHRSGLETRDMGTLFRYSKGVRIPDRLALRNYAGPLRLAIPCVDDVTITQYLNSPQTRQALHVGDAQSLQYVPRWDVCSAEINRNYIRLYRDMTRQYRQILSSKVRVLLYHGDVDMACNYLGGDWFVNKMALEVNQNYTDWYYRDVDNFEQIGGFAKTFKGPVESVQLTFATVRGAGHMVPTDKPLPAYELISRFVFARDIYHG